MYISMIRSLPPAISKFVSLAACYVAFGTITYRNNSEIKSTAKVGHENLRRELIMPLETYQYISNGNGSSTVCNVFDCEAF